MKERLQKMLEALGFTTRILEHNGKELIDGTLEIGDRKIAIICGMNGTARIDKPNGTHKWVYERTPAQIAATLRQIIDCNRP